MKFLVVSNAPTFTKGKKLSAYAPYVKEMNIWIKYVERVTIASPDFYPHEVHTTYFQEQNIRHFHLSFLDFRKFSSILKSVFLIPRTVSRLFSLFSKAEQIHLRVPGNIGLIACLCQIFFPAKLKTAKYAGNWDPQAKQPWSYSLQKWILSNTFLTRNMQVLVYGEWPGQSKNIVPFFTASFSEKVIPEVKEKDFSGPLNFLFVGNLIDGKQPLEAVKLVQQLRQQCKSNAINLDIYGDGPERARITKYCKENKLEDFVHLKGNCPLEELKAAYQKAHFVILPSRSEGWPKAIAEGMFFGCIPIATPVSCVPWMLGFGSRGVLLVNQANGEELKTKSSQEWSVVRGQWSGDVTKISHLLADPDRMKKISEEAKKWSQQFTLEKFEAAIKDVLKNEKRDV